MPRLSALIHVIFCLILLNYFIFHVIKGIKNGCPCIVEVRGSKGCALASSLYEP